MVSTDQFDPGQQEQKDRQLEQEIRQVLKTSSRFRRRVSAAVGLILVVVLTMAIIQLSIDNARLASQVRTDNAELKASCAFYRDLAGASLPAKPQPPEVTIRFLADAVFAYRGQGCGPIEPSAELLHWAKVYKLPLR